MKKHFIYILLIASVQLSCTSEKETHPFIGDISELVFASGQVEWDDIHHIAAQSQGVISELSLDIGDSITTSQFVGKIDNPSSFINSNIAKEQLAIANRNNSSSAPALLQLKQQISIAKNIYTNDSIQLIRHTGLLNSGNSSKMEFDQMALKTNNSKLNVVALKNQYDQVRSQAKVQQLAASNQASNSEVQEKFTNLISYQSGMVIAKHKNNGDYARMGEIILSIANPNKLIAKLNIDENSISKIKIGQSVLIQLNTNKEVVLKGHISKIQTAFDKISQSFICEAVFENIDQFILHGTQLEGNIVIGKKQHVLLIPRNLLGYGNKVQIKGAKDLTTIKTGIVSSNYVEVLEGLTESDVLLPIQP
jgi:multidrug efflux pump subunit AcrA (membrane-fusion protein)